MAFAFDRILAASVAPRVAGALDVAAVPDDAGNVMAAVTTDRATPPAIHHALGRDPREADLPAREGTGSSRGRVIGGAYASVTRCAEASRTSPGDDLDEVGRSAGDAFCAGFLARFVRGEALGDCATGAVAAAARVMGEAGARP